MGFPTHAFVVQLRHNWKTSSENLKVAFSKDVDEFIRTHVLFQA